MRRRDLIGGAFICGFGPLATTAQTRERTSADEEKLWREYLDWYRHQPIDVADTRRAYLDHLRRAGLRDAEIQSRSALIERLSRERRGEIQPLFFDRTYASPKPRFNTAPNALLVESVRDRKPGAALDIHMGQGRNAIYLASKGWRVTGFDFSAEGVRAARAAAGKAGARITALECRHEDFDFGRDRWDLIVMTYTWVPLRSEYIPRIIDSLKPGGILVFEHFLDESASDGAAPWLPRRNELLTIYEALRILRYEDTLAPADWSWRPSRIARLIAEK